MEWQNLHLDGTAHIDTLDVDNGANITGGVVVNTLKVSDLTNNRVVIVGDGTGELADSPNLTFNGSTLALTGNQTISSTLSVSSSLSVGADVTLGGELNMMGASSSNKYLDVNIGTNAFHIRGTSGGDGNHIHMIRAFRAGAVELNYSGTKRIETNNTGAEVTGTLTATLFSGSGASLTSLNASNISSGTINDARLPATITSNITGNAASSDTVDVADQGSANANKFLIFTDGSGAAKGIAVDGNLTYNPSSNTLNAGNLSGSINAGSVNSGTLADARIPNLNASKTNAGTFADARIPSLNASKINAGVFADARIPNLNASKTNAGTFNADRIPTLNGSKISSGTVNIDRLSASGTRNENTFLAGNNTFKSVVVAINSITTSGANRVLIDNGNATATADQNVTYDNVSFHVHGGSRQIICDGNIVAFNSDIRLKTAIQPIENAVAKTLKLNGFTYEHNEVAKSIGYKLDGERFAGVSAQDVQSVLPEAVKPAPANENYLTVQYEKIVPLLIEAIKELKAEIDELKK